MRSCRYFAFALFAAAALRLPAFADQAVQILIVTGDRETSPDACEAADRLAGKDSSASNKSGFRHVALDKATFLDPASLKKTIVEYSADPRIRGIVVSPAMAGTASAFQAVKDKRIDVSCAAIDSRERTLYIESYADLIVGTDIVARAARLARLARQYGIPRILAIPGTSPYSQDESGLFDAVLSAACADSGVALAVKPAKEGLEPFMKRDAEANPGRTLLWASEVLDPAVLGKFLASGNYVIESPYPSLISDYSGLLAQDARADPGDYQKILKRFEKAAIDSGFAGHLGTWVFPESFVLTSAVSEFLRKNAGKRFSPRYADALLEEIQRSCPGTKPALTQRIDPGTGVKSKNHFLFKEEIYVLGKGFVSPAPSDVPAKYRALDAD